MKRFNKPVGQRGFTLIELMIVVAIIGILAAVAIPKFAEMIRKSKEGATKGSLSALRSALTIYLSDNEGVPPLSRSVPTLAQVEVAMLPKYIEAFPTAKLGQYHSDTNAVNVSAVFSPFDGNRNTTTITNPDLNGWMFVTDSGGGAWWTNCFHTDTKNNVISGW